MKKPKKKRDSSLLQKKGFDNFVQYLDEEEEDNIDDGSGSSSTSSLSSSSNSSSGSISKKSSASEIDKSVTDGNYHSRASFLSDCIVKDVKSTPNHISKNPSDKNFNLSFYNNSTIKVDDLPQRVPR